MKTLNEQLVKNTMKFLEEAGMICAISTDSHIIVMGNLGMVDVWPTTGKWRTRQPDNNMTRTNIYELKTEFQEGLV